MPLDLTIREAAEKFGVSTHTLRYYEKQGLVEVPRSPSGDRLYGELQLSRLRFLLHLRGAGMGIAGLRAYAALVNRGDETVMARRAQLVQHEQAVIAQISQMEEHLQAIRRKIRKYDAQQCFDRNKSVSPSIFKEQL